MGTPGSSLPQEVTGGFSSAGFRASGVAIGSRFGVWSEDRGGQRDIYACELGSCASHFEVSGDLKAGDQVVSGPFSALRNLKDGDAVKIKEKKADKEKGKGKGSSPDSA